MDLDALTLDVGKARAELLWLTCQLDVVFEDANLAQSLRTEQKVARSVIFTLDGKVVLPDRPDTSSRVESPPMDLSMQQRCKEHISTGDVASESTQMHTQSTVSIDRSPALFKYVLSYLESGCRELSLPDPDDGSLEEGLHAEFEFYGLPWPRLQPEPSVMDAFRGNLECVPLDYDFHADAMEMQPGRVLLVRNTGRYYCGVLYNSDTGRRIDTWFSTHPEHEVLLYMRLTRDFVVAGYRQNPVGKDPQAKAVLFSSKDGTFYKSFSVPFSDRKNTRVLVAVMGNRLVAVGTQAISAYDVNSGALLWETPFSVGEAFSDSRLLKEGVIIDDTFNDDVFLCRATDSIVLLEQATGAVVYIGDMYGLLSSTATKGHHADPSFHAVLVGRELRAIARDPFHHDWFLYRYGPTGEEFQILSLSFLFGGYISNVGAAGDGAFGCSVRFHDADVLSVHNGRDNTIAFYRFDDGTEANNGYTESLCVELVTTDGETFGADIGLCGHRMVGNELVVGGNDGIVRVWRTNLRNVCTQNVA